MTQKRFSNIDNMIGWLKLMLLGAYTIREMANRTGMHYETLRPIIKRMHAEGLVHVAGWRVEATGRHYAARYQYGIGVDAKKPRPRTVAERQRKYNAKLARVAEDKLSPASTRLVANSALESAFGMGVRL